MNHYWCRCDLHRNVSPIVAGWLAFVVFMISIGVAGIGGAFGDEIGGGLAAIDLPILNTRVDSWPVDPAMNREQEREIWRKLFQPYTPLQTSVPLDEWVKIISPLCRIALDDVSLEEMGLTADTPLRFRDGGLPRPLVVDAMLALEAIYCVIEVRGGVVRIVTVDAAADRLPVRIYDVSELTGAPATSQWRLRVGGLIETIQCSIDPDNWEVLGGTSTIQVHSSPKSSLLCIATSTQTHWQVQVFLDQLRRASGGEPRASGMSAGNAASPSGLPRFQPE